MMRLTDDLVNTLRSEIAQGTYRAGELIPSERELSANKGLSRTTVRRAIQTLVNEGVVYRVPGSGTYVGRAQPLTTDISQEHATLGLIVPALSNPYFGELANAIERESTRIGYQLLLGQSRITGDNVVPYLTRYAENPAVKGVIAVATWDEVPVAAYEQLARVGKPLMFVVRHAENLGTDSDETDHIGGSRTLVRYLAQLGHRDIAFIGVTPPRSSRHYEGYIEGLREAGLSEDPELQVRLDVDELERLGEEGVRVLLQRGVRFTAIFAQIDQIAIGVLRALRAAGLRVPDDVSLVGFDNIPSAQHLHPPLTTVDHTIQEIGHLAVLLLQDRISGRYNGPARRVVIQPQLVLRESCAPVPAQQSRETQCLAKDATRPNDGV